MHKSIIQSLNTTLGLQLPETLARTQLETALAERINDLIQHNFNQLIYLLYRIDVSEAKLKQLLKENPGEDAGRIIAQLIIERQQQKLEARQQFRQANPETDEEEKW